MSLPGTSRRVFLRLLGGSAAAVAVGSGAVWLAAPGQIGKVMRSQLRLPQPFSVPLPVPPVLRPRRDGDTDHYEIVHEPALRELLPGVRTEIWGYDGQFPGPTITSRGGRKTVVLHRNRLPVPTVVHLHGGHTPAASDGYPTDLILPEGASGDTGPLHHAIDGADDRAVVTHGARTYEYPFRQRAATLWYHDHRMDFTGPALWRGLAGFHLVHDEEEEALPLPHDERDIPLMITDRAFADDGSLAYPATDPSLRHAHGTELAFTQGVLGDVILVNGAPWPHLEVDAVRYRFRLLNASNARRYRLALDPPPPGDRGFIQVGSDGGLLAQPVRHDRIEISPAERFDVVIDFGRYTVGQDVTLVNQFGSGDTRNVLRFKVVRRTNDDSHVPDRLSRVQRLDPTDVDVTRDVVFRAGDSDNGSWTVDDRTFDPNRTDATVRLGDTEIWRFTTDFHHPIHIHQAHFQVLSRNGEGPGPYDIGWKDTVALDAAGQVAVIVRFVDYPGRFVYHCHNLEHEDMGMMANIEIRQ